MLDLDVIALSASEPVNAQLEFDHLIAEAF
jgi:hypothetical protein